MTISPSINSWFSTTGHVSMSAFLLWGQQLETDLSAAYAGDNFASAISPTILTASQNDYAPASFASAVTVRLSSDASRDITGLAGGAAGRLRILHNVGVNPIVLKDESASSAAANRFALNGDVTLNADQSVIIHYDSTSSRWRVIGSTATGGGGGGSGDFSSNTSSSVDGEIVLFSGTGGKTGKRATTTGLLKATSGVLAAAVSGTDYAPATSGNNVLKGNGAGGFANALAADLPIADAGSYFATDNVEAALQYLGGIVAALDQAVVLKGSWDASAGSFPGSGAAQAGWSYIVSVAGTVNSVSFAVGDRIIAITDNASTSTYASNWFKADYTDQVSSVAGRTGAVTLSQSDISGLTTSDSPLFAAISFGNTDTTVDRLSAGDIQVEGNRIFRVGGADVPIADGGTGASTAQAAYDNLSVKGSDIVAAATLNLDSATGRLVDVTGTTGISAITLAEGRERHVRFTGALTLTHGSSLVLPTGANITTAAGDFAVFRGYTAGVVRCMVYTRASGLSLAGNIPAGGTTGQVLKKNSNTDYDYSWQADSVSGGGGGGDVTGPASAAVGQLAAFAATDGKSLQVVSTTGLLKATSGVVAAAVSGTDYAPATSGSSVLKANGSGGFANASAVDLAITDAGSYFSTDNVEAALQYLGGIVAALDQAVVLKGSWDASSGSFPGSGSAQSGWSYIVSVAGTVNSVDFAVGDRIIAIVDNASTSTYASNWFKADYTDAVSSVAGRTGAVTLAQADISGLTTASSPQFASVNVGHASDTPLTRVSAGVLAVAGVNIATNTTSLAHTASQYEIGHASDTTLARVSAGVASIEGETIHTNSISRTLTAAGVELGHASDTTLSRASAGVVSVEGIQLLKANGSQTLSGGFRQTSHNLGTITSGTTTPDAHNGNFQHLTWNATTGTVTIAAPANDCAIDIMWSNNATGTLIGPTFSGFTAPSTSGDAFATTNNNKYLLMIRRINSIATYAWKALQ